MMDLVVGIDPSLLSTGVCAIVNGVPKAFMIKSINVDKKNVVGDFVRANHLRSKLRRELSRVCLPYSCDVIVGVEGVAFARQANRAAQTGMVHYATYSALKTMSKKSSQKFFIYIIPPKTMKKFVTGNGNAGKDLVSKKLKADFDCPDYSSSDTFDAYGLAVTAKALHDGKVRGSVDRNILCNGEFSWS